MASTVWRGRIAFGMVSIPVRLHKAARRERVRFHHVYRPEPEPEEPVAGAAAAAEEEEAEAPAPNPAPNRGIYEVPPAAEEAPPERVVRVHNAPAAEAGHAPILKGYEVAKDDYMVLKPSEVAELRPKTSTELNILEFVLLQEIDPIFFDTSYYVVPDRGGEKPYAILFEALLKSGYVALGNVAMHGREHAVVIRPANRGLVLHSLFYANEVRSNEAYVSDSKAVAAKEQDLATMLIQALAAKFDPAKLKDTFEERLRELIDTRALSATARDAAQKEPARAPAADIMEALRKSLAMARKPVQSEAGEKKTGKTARRQKG